MHQAAYVLAAFALLSQSLALVRDRLFAAQFGAGHTLDVYYAAFRIPDLLFAGVASLLSLYAARANPDNQELQLIIANMQAGKPALDGIAPSAAQDVTSRPSAPIEQ